jgi:hypothetical protein
MSFAAFRRCLLALDVPGMKRLWRETSPHLHQPQSDDEMLETMHRARVGMNSVPADMRDCSVRWLEERARMRTMQAVGVATSAKDPGLRDALLGGMTRAVESALAGGVAPTDAKTIHPLVWDARDKIKHGRVSV